METMTADTKSRGGSTAFSHLTAREMELLLHRIDHPGEPVPPPHMDDEDATTALHTQQTMRCVQENCMPCTGWIAPELFGKTKPCTCTCHDTEEDDEEDDGAEYLREVCAQAADDMYLLD